GFTAVVDAGMFLLALFFSPLLCVVTSEVTAPALIIVGVLMSASLKNIEWDKFEITVPDFLTFATMTLIYTIATGNTISFVFYRNTMIIKVKAKEIHLIMYGMFVIFIFYFAFLT